MVLRVRAEIKKGYMIADRVYQRDGHYFGVFRKQHCLLVFRPPDKKWKEFKAAGYRPVAWYEGEEPKLTHQPELWFWHGGSLTTKKAKSD